MDRDAVNRQKSRTVFPRCGDWWLSFAEADDPRVRKAPAKKYLPTLPTHGRGHQSGSVFATIACLQAARAGGICAA